MSDALIVRRGGSGGLSANKAVIHVTAPAGSTITFSKGGVIVKTLGPEKSHVNARDNTLAEWYYAVSSSNYGAWSVSTATLSRTVSIDSSKQYDVALYYLYLYKNGNTCTDVTGGYTAYGMKQNSSYGGSAKTPTVTYNSTNVKVAMSSGGGMWRTLNRIDLTPFKTIKMAYRDLVAQGHVNCALFTNLNTYWDGLSKVVGWQPSEGAGIKSVDISNATGLAYFGTCLLYAGGNTSVVYEQIWLE